MKLISIFVVTLLVATGIGYYVFVMRPESATPAETEPTYTGEIIDSPVATGTVVQLNPTEPETPAQPESRLVAVTTEPVIGYWINQLDGQPYYVNVEGLVRRADAATGAETVSSSRFDAPINRVIPSVRGDAVMIVSGEPAAPVFKLFDLERRLWRILPAGTIAASWNPTGPAAEVAFIQTTASGGTEFGVYATAKGTVRGRSPLALTGVDMTWMSADRIYFTERPSRLAMSGAWSYSIKQKTLWQLLPRARGQWAQFTPNAGGFLYTAQAGNQLLDTAGVVESRIPFNTLPTKCFLERPIVYCAVSYGGLSLSAAPDAYLDKTSLSGDSILSFSLLGERSYRETTTHFDGEKTGTAFDASSVSKRGSKLYFINRYDSRVYSLEL